MPYSRAWCASVTRYGSGTRAAPGEAVAARRGALPPDVAISPAAPTLRRLRPSTLPSADKTWSAEYPITAPIPSRAAKTSARLVAQPSSCRQPTNQIRQRRQMPHRPTPASVRTPPAVSSLEAFRTPASVHSLASTSGRRPKTLNDCGPSRPCSGTKRFDPSRTLRFPTNSSVEPEQPQSRP